MPLKAHGVSMTRFESRPARSGQWEYYFYVDLDGHPDQPNVALALQELHEACAFFKVLGTYPVDVPLAHDRLDHVRATRRDRLRPDGRLVRARAEARGLVKRVIGYSKSPSTTEQAKRLGVIDTAAESALLAVSGSDIVLHRGPGLGDRGDLQGDPPPRSSRARW